MTAVWRPLYTTAPKGSLSHLERVVVSLWPKLAGETRSGGAEVLFLRTGNLVLVVVTTLVSATAAAHTTLGRWFRRPRWPGSSSGPAACSGLGRPLPPQRTRRGSGSRRSVASLPKRCREMRRTRRGGGRATAAQSRENGPAEWPAHDRLEPALPHGSSSRGIQESVLATSPSGQLTTSPAAPNRRARGSRRSAISCRRSPPATHARLAPTSSAT
jgi:hypothetical protein